MTCGVFRPPSTWTEHPGVAVMRNLDRSVDADVERELRAGGVYSRHAGGNFNGIVWFDAGRWHETVMVHGEPRGTYSADTLQQLMTIVNDEYGWD